MRCKVCDCYFAPCCVSGCRGKQRHVVSENDIKCSLPSFEEQWASDVKVARMCFANVLQDEEITQCEVSGTSSDSYDDFLSDSEPSEGDHADDLCENGSPICPVKPIIPTRMISYISQKGDCPHPTRTALISDICHQSDIARSKHMTSMVLSMRTQPEDPTRSHKGKFGCSIPFVPVKSKERNWRT
eukprot:gnl/Chilomastix_caulleri/3434.p1 GENE.gnl/Chilomastix_caulleri/3434~~gnl/Chilomastix_caulleri/3434.p1  ORF type:complete len:186 (+),score=13.67 gnl/Chilomastix_caulleri/3434:171-728(+)